MSGRDYDRAVQYAEARLREMRDPERSRLWEPSNAAVIVTVIVPIFGVAGMGGLTWASDFSPAQVAMSCAFALVPAAMIGGGLAGYFSKARFQDGPTYTRLGCAGRVALATIGAVLFAAAYVLASLVPL